MVQMEIQVQVILVELEEPIVVVAVVVAHMVQDRVAQVALV
jgi:hypothetical protein